LDTAKARSQLLANIRLGVNSELLTHARIRWRWVAETSSVMSKTKAKSLLLANIRLG